jgi:hypothetical protein
MDDVRADRWMALAGPGFLLLYLLAVLLPGSTPGEKASGKAVVDYYSSHTGAATASVFLLGPAAALLLVFASRFRTELGAAGAPRRLFQYGAIVYATAIMVGASFQLGVLTSSNDDLDAVAQTMNVLVNDSWIPLVIGAGVMLFGAGLAVLRTGALPRWLGWVGVTIGVLSVLGPGGFAAFFLAPMWVAVAGVMLYLRQDEPVTLPA